MKKRMRVILMGGLGNQLFQYTFAVSLARQYKSAVVMDPNFAAVRLDEFDLPEISKFDLSSMVSVARKADYPVLMKRLIGLSIRLNLQQSNELDRLFCFSLNKILETWLGIYFGEKVRIVFGRDNGFDQRYLLDKYSLFVGYFQSHRFSAIENVRSILETLKPKQEYKSVENLKIKAKLDKPLIVHVRLTDYRNEPNFGIPSIDYYKNAISNQLSFGIYNKIWLFSDEPEEAMEFIPLEYRSIVENISSLNLGTVESLEAMRLGNGYVIANSSFSWWAAFLSYTPGARVIYPDPWFSGMPTPKDLCPSYWAAFAR
jgi:hypothetical protein